MCAEQMKILKNRKKIVKLEINNNKKEKFKENL